VAVVVTVVIVIAVMPAVLVVPGVTVAIAIIVSSEMSPAFVAIAFIETVAPVRISAAVAVTAIVMAVNVSPETFAAVVPGSGADEDAIGKPLGAVVAIGSALVRSVVEVSVGADGRWADLDGNLCVSGLRRSSKEHREEQGQK